MGNKFNYTRGFVTIATGKECYYQLALNLLHSYRKATDNPLPFAVICDKPNELTREFDKVVILEHATCSYMDKLTMLSVPPFDFNIFIDADCLAYGDLNRLFDIVGNERRDGVWTFGRKYSLTSGKGWFKVENLGIYKDSVTFSISTHGGIIFFKDDEKTKDVYKVCSDIAQNYSSYNFEMFEKPADEPIIGLSMAVNGLTPIDTGRSFGAQYYVFYPVATKVVANICAHHLSYIIKGYQWEQDVLLLHWQNCNTTKALYKREVERLYSGKSYKSEFKYWILRSYEIAIDYKFILISWLYSLLHR